MDIILIRHSPRYSAGQARPTRDRSGYNFWDVSDQALHPTETTGSSRRSNRVISSKQLGHLTGVTGSPWGSNYLPRTSRLVTPDRSPYYFRKVAQSRTQLQPGDLFPATGRGPASNWARSRQYPVDRLRSTTYLPEVNYLLGRGELLGFRAATT